MLRALTIGINRYKSGNNLNGCCNDVDSIVRYLESERRCAENNVTVLKDEDATMLGIKESISMLIHKTMPGDSAFLHFSGHGTQVADINGDEKDKKDEVLCPHDFDWDGTFISDDWLKKSFAALPRDAYIEVLLDCCHSGTASRDLRSKLSRSIPSPVDLTVRTKNGAVKDSFKYNKGISVVWAGCDEDQTSADAHISGRWQGAFTCWWLRTAYAHPYASRSEVLKRLRHSLALNNFSQIPQLEVNYGGAQ